MADGARRASRDKCESRKYGGAKWNRRPRCGNRLLACERGASSIVAFSRSERRNGTARSWRRSERGASCPTRFHDRNNATGHARSSACAPGGVRPRALWARGPQRARRAFAKLRPVRTGPGTAPTGPDRPRPAPIGPDYRGEAALALRSLEFRSILIPAPPPSFSFSFSYLSLFHFAALPASRDLNEIPRIICKRLSLNENSFRLANARGA